MLALPSDRQIIRTNLYKYIIPTSDSAVFINIYIVESRSIVSE